MPKNAAATTELSLLQKWSSQVLLCLLLIAFSTCSYALSVSSESQLTFQQHSDTVFVVDLTSPISEVQAEDPEFDKSIDSASRVFQNVFALAPISLRITESKLTQWNWHLVRGPPAHL